MGPVRRLTLLWLLAVALALNGLGTVALRDWDEGIVAGVALAASKASGADLLLPTYWGEPYLNKPPGLHLLIAAAIRLWRWISGAGAEAVPPEFVMRLVPALLSTAVVPLVGLVQRRLRPGEDGAAVASAAIALTLLPLARHGRMAMLDGTQLAAMLLVWLGVLVPSRRRWTPLAGGLLAGAGGSALLLLKAPVALPVLLAALVLRLLDRDLDRRAWCTLLAGMALALLPGLAWHLWHGWARGPAALLMWTGQGLARISRVVGGDEEGGPLPPLREVLLGGWPWLTLWPAGMALAWRQRRERAGRWCCGLTLFVSLLVLPLRTQLPYYSLLLWPPFALVCGPVFARMVAGRSTTGSSPSPPGGVGRLPLLWSGAGALLLLGGGVSWVLDAAIPSALPRIGIIGGAGLLVGGWLLQSLDPARRRRGAITVVACLWLSLLLLFSGKGWLWELGEMWSVRPVARQLRPLGSQPLRLWRTDERPSLNWYVGRRLRRADTAADLDPDANGEIWLLSGQTPVVDPYRCRVVAPALYRCGKPR